METCYLDLDDPAFRERLPRFPTDSGLEAVLAWGHPGRDRHPTALPVAALAGVDRPGGGPNLGVVLDTAYVVRVGSDLMEVRPACWHRSPTWRT